MAKFLVATMPIPGHVLPMQPIVQALVERGHQVVWYGSRFLRSSIEASGARFEPIVSALDFGDSDYNRHFAGRSALGGLAQLRFDFKHVFVDPIAGHLKDLRQIQARFGADALLTEGRYRRAAQALQREAAQHDAPLEAARLLELLAAHRRPILALDVAGVSRWRQATRSTRFVTLHGRVSFRSDLGAGLVGRNRHLSTI